VKVKKSLKYNPYNDKNSSHGWKLVYTRGGNKAF